MNVSGHETFQNSNQVLAMPELLGKQIWEDTRTPTSIRPVTLFLAWAVRAALLVLYVPVKLFSAIVKTAYWLDLWASNVITQRSGQRAEPRATRGQVVQFLGKVQ
jgi:hypothetical protein